MSDADLNFISYIQSLDDKQLKYIAAFDYDDSQNEYFNELKSISPASSILNNNTCQARL